MRAKKRGKKRKLGTVEKKKKRKFQNTVKSSKSYDIVDNFLVIKKRHLKRTTKSVRPFDGVLAYRNLCVGLLRTAAARNGQISSTIVKIGSKYFFLILCMNQSFVNMEKRGILLETTYLKIVFQYCRSIKKLFLENSNMPFGKTLKMVMETVRKFRNSYEIQNLRHQNQFHIKF